MKIGTYEVEVLSNDEVKVGCVYVRRGDAQAVIALMDAWKPAPKLKVGDFVRVAQSRNNEARGWLYDDLFVDKYGKVAQVRTPREAAECDDRVIGVEFAFKSEKGGDTITITGVPSGHGRWFQESQLERVD